MNVLPSNNITTEIVRTTLNASNNDVGALCLHKNVNCWSKYKPTHSDCDTLTPSDLLHSNYSINVVVANTPQQLHTYIVENNNKGITYIKPNKYRLGDFRNYYHQAKQPITSVFADGDVIGLANIANQSLFTLTPQVDEYNVNVDDIYKCTNEWGEQQTLSRGVHFTNGTTEVWSTTQIPWNNAQWKQLANNGNEVIAIEFLTNVPANTISTQYLTQSTDRFFALPQPLHTITVNNDINTTNPLTSDVFVDGTFTLSQDNKCVNYSFRFSSIGDGYVGGALKNIAIKLSTDVKDTDVISYSNLDDITIGSETTSPTYTGTLSNRYDSTTQSYYTGILYVHIYYNNTKQFTKAVLKLNV